MRYARFVIPAALAAALLGGCGPKTSTPTASPSAAPSGLAALSARDIVALSVAALEKAGSYRMKGDVVVDRDDMIIDAKVQGADSRTVISIAGKGSITVLVVAGTTYSQPDEAFLKELGIDAKTFNAKFKGKWTKAKPGDTNMQKFADLGDAHKMLPLDGAEKMTKGDRASIAGVPAWTLTDPDGPTFYVATEGPAYPLRLDSGVEGKLDFSEFGAKFDDIKAPSPDTVIEPK